MERKTTWLSRSASTASAVSDCIVLRIMCENPETFDIRGINLRKADIDYMVYLLKYDSVFRNFPGMVEHAGGDPDRERP